MSVSSVEYYTKAHIQVNAMTLGSVYEKLLEV